MLYILVRDSMISEGLSEIWGGGRKIKKKEGKVGKKNMGGLKKKKGVPVDTPQRHLFGAHLVQLLDVDVV